MRRRRDRHGMGLAYGGTEGGFGLLVIYCRCGWSHAVLASVALGPNGLIGALYNGHLLRLKGRHDV